MHTPTATPVEADKPLVNGYQELMEQALAAQKAGRLIEAEKSYRSALSLNLASFDALHMLGVTRLQMGDTEGALELLVKAFPYVPPGFAAYAKNLSLCIAGVIRQRKLTETVLDGPVGMASRHFHRHQGLAPLPNSKPLVSIIVRPGEDLATSLGAIGSIANQTYRDIEVLVIDNALQEGGRKQVTAILNQAGLSHRFVHAEKNGLADAIQSGLSAAAGDYVAYLEDDLYSPDRVETMLRMLCSSDAEWGFSNVRFIDSEGRSIRFGMDRGVDAMMRTSDSIYTCSHVVEGFIEHDQALFIGNLFAGRALWQEARGLQEVPKRSFGWALSLEFSLRSEPAYLDEPTYVHVLREPRDTSDAEDTTTIRKMLSSWNKRSESVPFLSSAKAHYRNHYWLRAQNRLTGNGGNMELAELMMYASRLGWPVAAAEGAEGRTP